MPRRGKRVRVGDGIFRDSGSGYYSVIVHGVERRMPPDSTEGELLRRKAALVDEVKRERPELGAPAGSLRKDVARYLTLVKHLAWQGSVKATLGAWLKTRLADRPRRSITRLDILEIRGGWIEAGIAPGTCNNRVQRLRALWKTIDGEDAPTPCDRIKPVASHRTPAVAVPAADILAVDRRLQEYERRGILRNAKTRARFRVRASTGRRPSEIMRAQPDDVDMKRRIWTPRDGKGGFTPGIYLTADMLSAWRLFIDADAWGPFATGSHARVLRNCGWRKGVRPYQMRHSVGIALSEAGIDLADVQQMMGHKHQATTRKHYVPVIGARLQRAAEQLEGRLPWDQVSGSKLQVQSPVPRGGSMKGMEPSGKSRKKLEPLRLARRRDKGRKRA